MARRGENIYKRKDGRWEGRVPNGFYQDGRRKYRSIYSSSYTELKSKMRTAENRRQPSQSPKVYDMEDAFCVWLQDKRYTWKPSTYSCYLQLINRHLIPAVGAVPVERFGSAQLHDFIEKKRLQEKLSYSYIRDMTNIMIQTLRHLNDTYQYHIVIPSGSVKRMSCTEKQIPGRDIMCRLEHYLAERAADSTCLGILLCCYTGLRIGELCALQWEQVNLEAGVLHVRKTMQRITLHEENSSSSKIVISLPKTERSIRDIPLPPFIVEILRQHQKEADSYILQGKKMPYAEPRTVQYRFRKILKQCGLEVFNFHMLRHVFATRCVALGFDVNSVSELLGHANIQITLNRYVHSSDERKRLLMEQFQL